MSFLDKVGIRLTPSPVQTSESCPVADLVTRAKIKDSIDLDNLMRLLKMRMLVKQTMEATAPQ